MVGVEQWAEVRRLRFVRGLSIREIHRRTGLHRETIRRALSSEVAPVYRRASSGSKLDPFKDEIHRLLGVDPKLPGQRVRELIAQLGFEGGKTIVDDYLAEMRPVFLPPPRTFQRTVYRPGEICQFDLWEPRAEVAVGHGQTRRAWIVVACLAHSRAGAGTLIFTRQTPDLLAGIGRCLCRSARCPRRWSGTVRPACTPAMAGRPTSSPPSAGSCASTGTSASRPIRKPRAVSSGCRTSSSAARSRAVALPAHISTGKGRSDGRGGNSS